MSKPKKHKSIETDGKLVQTRVPPEDYAAVERMAKGSRLSMASMLRTMIASQADAYRQARKSDSIGKKNGSSDEDLMGSLLAEEVVRGEQIVGLVSGPIINDVDGHPTLGIYALTGAGSVLALQSNVDDGGALTLAWVPVDAKRLDVEPESGKGKGEDPERGDDG